MYTTGRSNVSRKRLYDETFLMDEKYELEWCIQQFLRTNTIYGQNFYRKIMTIFYTLGRQRGMRNTELCNFVIQETELWIEVYENL